jgi:hypothetical protein
MQNAIFSTASKSYLVNHVIHAGPVLELSQQNRKSNNTHYFKLTTTSGPAYCHFPSEEVARRARGVLGARLGTVKQHLFRSKGDCIDIASIVSFGRVMELKSDNDEIFGFPVNIDTITDKSDAVWLTFKTEDSATNVRKALYAAIMSYYALSEDQSALNETESENNSNVKDEAVLVEA